MDFNRFRKRRFSNGEKSGKPDLVQEIPNQDTAHDRHVEEEKNSHAYVASVHRKNQVYKTIQDKSIEGTDAGHDRSKSLSSRKTANRPAT